MKVKEKWTRKRKKRERRTRIGKDAGNGRQIVVNGHQETTILSYERHRNQANELKEERRSLLKNLT